MKTRKRKRTFGFSGRVDLAECKTDAKSNEDFFPISVAWEGFGCSSRQATEDEKARVKWSGLVHGRKNIDFKI